MDVRTALPRVVGFGCLATYSSYHWFALIADPPLARWAGLVALAAAAGLALVALDAALRSPVLRAIAAAAVTVAALAAALVVSGVPAELLAPGRWGELRAELATGLADVSELELPYGESVAWTRLGIVLGAAPALIAAAALAFWPAARGAALRQGLALAVLIALYGVAVTWHAPQAELARGAGLLVAAAAFLWLPLARGRRLLPALAVVALAAGLALPAAAAVRTERSWIAYKSWKLFAGQQTTSFDWEHNYGPLEWPQQGTTLLEIRAPRPLLWRTAVLDSFDGERWSRLSDGRDVPGRRDWLAGASPRLLERGERRGWTHRFDVEVRALESQLVPAAGTLRDLQGVELRRIAADGTAITAGGSLGPGDSYSATAYAPDPDRDELRRLPDRYPRELSRYTTLTLPVARPRADFGAPVTTVAPLTTVTVPLRGSDSSPGSAQAAIAGTPYARVGALAAELTEGKGAFGAARSIERYLNRGFSYRQGVPERQQPLSAFLFRDRAGYCQQFSGAMALMLRMSGIPARVATGFTPGSRKLGSEVFTVRDTDAHSWVEVWFSGIGWVPFDPTPALAPAASQSLAVLNRSGELSRLDAPQALSSERAAEAETAGARSRQPSDSSGSVLGRIVTALLAVAALAGGWSYRRRRRLLLRPGGIEAQLLELERALPRLGLELSGGITLAMLERRLQHASGEGAARYVRALRHHRFAPGRPRRPGPEQRAALRRALARGGPLRRLRAWRAFPPGGPARTS